MYGETTSGHTPEEKWSFLKGHQLTVALHLNMESWEHLNLW